jgi:hypothetical protein
MSDQDRLSAGAHPAASQSAEGTPVSKDLVALVSSRPTCTPPDRLGEPLEIRETSGGTLQLHDAEGRLLVSIEAPSLVEVQGEARTPPGRVGPCSVLVGGRTGHRGTGRAVRVAQRLTDGLVKAQGGLVWSGRDGHDVMTAKAVVLHAGRAAGAVATLDRRRPADERRDRRALQIVTPITSRLSWPLRQALTGPDSRWVSATAPGTTTGSTGPL